MVKSQGLDKFRNTANEIRPGKMEEDYALLMSGETLNHLGEFWCTMISLDEAANAAL